MELTKIYKILQLVISKAWEDFAFRRNLVEDLINSNEEFASARIKFPTGKKLIVNDLIDSSKVYINIPETNPGKYGAWRRAVGGDCCWKKP